MATNSGNLVNALIAGGVSAPAARVIANAIANAATPQFSRGGDVADATPSEDLRLVTADARKYQFGNLDYSPDTPLQDANQSNPGRYVPGKTDHPYINSQPVQPVPPLSGNAVRGGDYIEVANTVDNNTPLATASLKVSAQPGTHVRLNKRTKTCEAVPITTTAPQGLVTADIQEESRATNIELAVRQLTARSIVDSTGATVPLLTWGNPAGTAGTAWTSWAAANLLAVNNQLAFLTGPMGYQTGTWTPVYGSYDNPATLGSRPTCTYTSERGGWFIKLQKLVVAWGVIKTSARSTVGTGSLVCIEGLPAQFNAPSSGALPPFYCTVFVGLAAGFGTTPTYANVVNGSPIIRLHAGPTQLAQTIIPAAATAELQFTAIYFTDGTVT